MMKLALHKALGVFWGVFWGAFLAFVCVALPLTGQAKSRPMGPGEPKINERGGVPKGYHLSWSDEFSVDGLPDARIWGYDTGANKTGWYNNEEQYYAKARLKNSRVDNGHLIIEAHKEDMSAQSDWGHQAYSSARLLTKGRKTFTYGFVEVRAKLPCHSGAWPAIWTLADKPDSEWPDDGEVDIMEHVGSQPDQIHQTLHTKNHYFVNNTQKGVVTKIEDVCGAFHLYQMTWTRKFIKLGVDGQNYLIYRNEGRGNYKNWPFNKAQFLILNLAVGGDFGGKPKVDETSMPWKMQVDYVRVYQLR